MASTAKPQWPWKYFYIKRFKHLLTGKVVWQMAEGTVCQGPIDWEGDHTLGELALLPVPEGWVHDVDCTECVPHHETMSWEMRWRLFGPKSYSWWWVRRWGKMECGCCTRNPLTRKQLLYAWKCPNNKRFRLFGEDDGDLD